MADAPETFVGRSRSDEDIVHAAAMQRMAATLGLGQSPPCLPPLWHWMLFQHWEPPHALGEDGHPRRGGFLPDPAGLPRRMWAGSRIRLLRDLHPGERVRRVATIAAITPRTGKSGSLLFATVDYDIFGESGLALREQQDIVYRAAGSPAAPAAEPVRAVPQASLVPDPLLLFRYSALTGNGHRIHYDAPYATATEGYPALVVHGPLIATLLLGLLPPVRQAGLATLAIRAQRAAFCGNRLDLCAEAEGPATMLRALDHQGSLCMTVQAG